MCAVRCLGLSPALSRHGASATVFSSVLICVHVCVRCAQRLQCFKCYNVALTCARCMYACVHVWRMCMHAYMHTCIHAYMHTCMCRLFTYSPRMYAYMHTCMCRTRAYKHVPLYVSSYILGRILTCMCRTRAYMHVSLHEGHASHLIYALTRDRICPHTCPYMSLYVFLHVLVRVLIYAPTRVLLLVLLRPCTCPYTCPYVSFCVSVYVLLRVLMTRVVTCPCTMGRHRTWG